MGLEVRRDNGTKERQKKDKRKDRKVRELRDNVEKKKMRGKQSVSFGKKQIINGFN